MLKTDKQTDKTEQNKATKKKKTKQNNTHTHTHKNIIMCHKTYPKNTCILGFSSGTKMFCLFFAVHTLQLVTTRA